MISNDEESSPDGRRSSSRSPRRSKPERDSKAKERSRRGQSSRSTPGAVRSSSTSERNKRRSAEDHNNKSSRRGGRISSRSNSSSLSPKRGEAGRSITHSSSDRKKERRSTRASTPGARQDSARRSGDRKKERRSARASTPGAVPEEEDAAGRRRERRKGERANSSSLPSGPPLTDGALLEATTVDAEGKEEEVEKMRRDFEEKEKKRREEFENKEKLRQQEIKDLNTKLAKQRAEEEARKEERKKRKKKITIVGVCCIIVLVGAGAATFVSLTQDETTTPFENLEDATSVPSSAPSNGPTVTQLYQPPSEDDCLAIATNQTIVGQENLEQTDFDIAFDVTLQSGCDLTAQDVQILLDSIQQTILPSLAGCPTQTATRRGLRANKGNPMIRGTVTQKQRQLAIGDSRFVISNGFATGGVDSTFVCGDTQDSSHRIVVNLFLTLNGPVELTDLVSLTFDQIADLLKNAGQEGDNLKDPLGLNNSFSELRLVRVGDQDVPTTAPTPMPSTDSGQTPSPTAVVALTLSPTGMPVVGLTSQAPSSSPSRITALPSMRPTLAPVSGPTPPPTASPTARPSDTPSSQPSSLPTLAPTLAPVVGPTLPPTPLPTAIPSEVPSSSPSKSPTPVPTPGPTPLPSSNPSIQSSMAPSSNPSIQPSTVPSVVPSLKPSMNPSQTPTVFTQQCFESNFELGSQVGNWFGTTLQKTTVENTYGPIGDWCFGTGVTSMRFLFQYRSTFNEDISNWDVSSVTNMAGMFELATSFNQDLSSWDVSSLIDISAMFRDASSFNQDLCPWGPRLPIPNQSVVGAFVNTSCPFQSDPSFASNPPGPFCTFCPLTAVGPGPSM